MRQFNMTLAEALTSPLTTEAELLDLADEAKAAGETSIETTARDEIERRRSLEEAIEEGAAPCDGGPTPGGCH